MNEAKSEIRRFRQSVRHAVRGLRYAIRTERNFQLELVAAVFVVALIIIFEVKNWEAILLMLMVSWVLILELINTVVERVVDILKPGVHPYARLAKDIMAAVVLISSAVALGVGLVIFLPYFRAFF